MTYADVLIVGGGGGGSCSGGGGGGGGGGGAGGVIIDTVSLGAHSYTITVGAGGNGAIGTHAAGSHGKNSSAFGLTAIGGGAGNTGTGGADINGGSGGGSGASSNGVMPFGTGVSGQGNSGGTGVDSGTRAGGGGGGAGGVGGNGSSGSGGIGGVGIESRISGIPTYYAGGGAGATTNSTTISAGGNGGGGATFANGTDGLGGGGGAGYDTSRASGAGGSGIVLVKPNPGALDGLGTTIYTQAVGAYALRRLFGAYTGAQVRLRRSTDNAEVDVTFDKYGHLVDFDMGGWLEGATAYVTTWYDQSGNGNNVTQATTSKQPKYDTTNKIEFVATSQHSLLRTPGVLTAGDDTYTFAGVFEPHTTAGQVVCEQNSSTSTTNERACVILSSGKIGHNGQNNDAASIVASTLNQKNRFVMRVNNGVSPNIKLNHEGTNYTKTSTNPATLNVSGYGFSIGYKLSTNTEYFDGFISEIIVFNTEISDTETNAIISLAHAIKNGPGVSPPLPLALQ